MAERSSEHPDTELIEALRGYGFLADFHLSLYAGDSDTENGWHACSSALCPPVCSRTCRIAVEEATGKARGMKPATFRCPVGILGFILPLPPRFGKDACLVGGGVRERSLNLFWIEAAAKAEEINPFSLLEQLQEIPVYTEKGVEESAARACGIIASILQETRESQADDALTERLRIITAISSEIDGAGSLSEACTILGETVGMLFDVPGIAVVLPDPEEGYAYSGIWGFCSGTGEMRAEVFGKAFPQKAATKRVLRGETLREAFPEVSADSAAWFPLLAGGVPQGVIVFFSMDFRQEEYLLVEILTGRTALRLAKLRGEEEFTRKSALSGRLMEMIGTLSLAEGKEFYRLILEMATELANASCGSLMLIEESGESLRIESAIGMNPQLARTLNLRLGSGIAGKVAVSGNPLVVNDIEKDERVSTRNRPRFKTKSFISMPFVFKGRISGVLNLSDKKNQGIFTEKDLDTLMPFVTHVSSMIQRTSSQEKVEMLERLSITDPLTELYNRRFLEKRMEEEISRSMRNGLHLTVMLIDLDHFKSYNDLCGHIAGDKALKKAAKILRSSVREMDVVTRYGGEEFCVLLPGTSKKESIFVAERIRRDIENEAFAGENDLPLGRLTASIGVSSFPEDGNTPTALINVSDIALYRAKSEGRNRIVIFDGKKKEEVKQIPLQFAGKR